VGILSPRRLIKKKKKALRRAAPPLPCPRLDQDEDRGVLLRWAPPGGRREVRRRGSGGVRPSHARETEFGAGRRAPRVDVSVHPSIVPCSAPDDTFFDSFFPQERMAT
jgi:hypothetical protein